MTQQAKTYTPTAQDYLRVLEENAALEQELETSRQLLAFAIDKLPKKQIKIDLTEQTNLHGLALQMKQEKSGAILFRSVKA